MGRLTGHGEVAAGHGEVVHGPMRQARGKDLLEMP